MTTEAPTMPVQAAKTMQTAITASPTPPRIGPEEDPQGLEELIRHPRHGEEVSHQDEKGDRHQDEVVHRPVDPVHEDSEELRSDEGESRTGRRPRRGRRPGGVP